MNSTGPRLHVLKLAIALKSNNTFFDKTSRNTYEINVYFFKDSLVHNPIVFQSGLISPIRTN